MRPNNRTATAMLAALLALATSAMTYAAHPQVRGDDLNSGLSSGRGSIDSPHIVWRQLLGRDANPDRVTFTDCDGDQRTDVLLIEGADIVARHWSGQEIWRVALPGAQRFDRLVDLDGDGPGPEYAVLPTGDGRMHLLSVVSGHVVFSTDPDVPSRNNQTSQSRVGDLAGDSRPELLLTGFSGHSLVLTDDGAGGVRSRELPEHFVPDDARQRPYYAPYGATLADVDGDGSQEIVLVGRRVVRVYHARDEGERWVELLGSNADPVLSGHPLLMPDGAPIDAEQYGKVHSQVMHGPDGRDRILLSVDEARFGRRLFVLSYAPEPDTWGRIETTLYWEVDDPEADRHQRLADAVADFDGDGWPEIVTGGRIGGRDAVRIFTTAPNPAGPVGPGCVAEHDQQPALVGCLTDQRPAAIWHSAIGPLLVTADDHRTTAWTLNRGDGFEFARVDGMPEAASVVKGYDIETTHAISARWQPLRSGVDGELLVTVDGRLQRLAVTGQAIERLVSASNTTLKRFWARPGVAGAPEVIGLDEAGGLIPFDDGLVPHHTRRGDPIRLRVPGWTGATGITRQAQVASFTGGRAEQIVMADANLGLMIIDASEASQAAGANILRTHPGAWRATLADVDLDGRPDVVTVQDDALVAFGSDGQRLFSTPFMGPEDRVQRSIIASGTGDGLRLFAVTSSLEDGYSTLHAFDRHGERVWPAHRSEFVTRGSNLGFPLARGFDGDGPGEVYLPLGSRMYRFTADGGQRVGPISWQYPEWVVAAHQPESPITHLVTEQDAIRRVELAAGVDHASVADFQTGERPLVVLTCPDGRMIATGVDDAATVRTFDVHRDREYPPLFLANGQAERVQRPPTGRLGDPTGIIELVDRRPGVVVGSDDGYLYAVHPCGTPDVDTDPVLAWSRPFDAAVGVPVFADTDGDLQAELVVPVADGYLYGIDGTHAFGLDAPQWIADVDADQPDQPPVDIDATSAEVIAAKWAPIDGANYQYTVLDADDRMLGEWLDTPRPQADWNVGLVEGERYRFVVRAFTVNGRRSEEVISDGVFYRPAPPEALLACGQDPLCSSCDCEIGGDGPDPSPMALALLTLLIGWRRFT